MRMTRPLLLLLAAAAVTVPVGTGTAHALPPVCVQYNDLVHMGSYPVCVLGKTAGPAVPTSVCDVAELVGYRWVRECEGVV